MNEGKDNPAYIHGMTDTPTYRSWATMLTRCYNPSVSSYCDYGGRGVEVCERWRTFANFFADMGVRPKGMSLDRKNNDGNYEPDNCRWATRAEQNNNSRHNLLVTVSGATHTVKQWARLKAIPYPTLLYRVNQDWHESRLFTSPRPMRRK